jgi:hypothetical protein
MGNPRFDRMTRQHVIRAAQTLSPKRVQKWSCIVPVNGTEKSFPVKQLFMAAANLVSAEGPPTTPADFIAHFAVARLKKLGFPVQYSGTDATHSKGEEMMNTDPAGTVPERILAFLKGRPGDAYCDDSIAKLVGINRYMAQQSTLPFGLTSDFKRAYGACADCGNWKLVIAWVKV